MYSVTVYELTVFVSTPFFNTQQPEAPIVVLLDNLSVSAFKFVNVLVVNVALSANDPGEKKKALLRTKTL